MRTETTGTSVAIAGRGMSAVIDRSGLMACDVGA
jgi:hypothetical protein